MKETDAQVEERLRDEAEKYVRHVFRDTPSGEMAVPYLAYLNAALPRELLIRDLVEALEFYADEDNWDTDHMSPTIWDDGAIDLGKRATKALEKVKERMK